jgi:hypothetical protein
MRRKILILNEITQAEKILNNGFTNGIMFGELMLLAKYFKALGLRPQKIKERIIEFCTKEDEFFNIDVYDKMITAAINKSKNYKIKSVEGINIPIFEEEIDAIKFLPHRLYKILFVMLALSKYQKFFHSRIKNKKRKRMSYFLNFVDFEDICRIAGLGSKNITKKLIYKIRYELDGKGGFISSSKFSESSYQIMFARDEGKIISLVRDLENITDFIPYFCVDCKKQFNKKGKRDRCDDCYLEYRRKINRENMQRSRKKV